MHEWNLPELNSMPVPGHPDPRTDRLGSMAPFLPKVSDALAPSSLPKSLMTPESTSFSSLSPSLSLDPLGKPAFFLWIRISSL